MNPTYKVGDVVQIISEEEVYSCPTDNFGNFILAHSRYGANDFFTEKNFLFAAVQLSLPAFPKAMKGAYTISPLSSLKIKPFFTGTAGTSTLLNFTLISFLHPRFPCPLMIC